MNLVKPNREYDHWENNTDERILCLNVSKTYLSGKRSNLYECTRKYWRLNGELGMQILYLRWIRGLLSVYTSQQSGILQRLWKDVGSLRAKISRIHHTCWWIFHSTLAGGRIQLCTSICSYCTNYHEYLRKDIKYQQNRCSYFSSYRYSAITAIGHCRCL